LAVTAKVFKLICLRIMNFTDEEERLEHREHCLKPELHFTDLPIQDDLNLLRTKYKGTFLPQRKFIF
jgi:hypothetical protein